MKEEIDFTRYKTENDLDLFVCNTEKFKTTLIQLYFIQPIKSDTASKTALIPFILYRGSNKYPTSRDFEIRLEELYGANLNVSILKRGENQLIRFSLEVINDKNLAEKENIMEKGLELIHELVVNPLFSEKYVEQEKNYLRKEIKSLINDKYTYAVERCLQEMCAKEDYGIYKFGNIEGLQDINKVELYNYYQELFLNNYISLIIIGDVDKPKVYKKVNELFSFKHIQPKQINITKVIKRADKVKKVVENMKINQGKLSLGFRTGLTRKDDLYYALLYYNGILGAFPHSKLFQNVREELSLAYYINSQLESTKGLLLISSGIDFHKYEFVKEAIYKQIKKMALGKFTDTEIEYTKTSLINYFKTVADNIQGIAGHFLLGIINEKLEIIKDTIRKLEDIKRDDIIEVAQNVKLDTIYFLSNKEAK